jgi:dipeptidyl aminopeptidase/acylaminoacyl peptidase
VDVKSLRIAFLIAGLVAASGAGAWARPWTLQDVANVPFADDVVLSPDGHVALIDLDTTDMAHDTFANAYHRIDMQTGANTAMPSDLYHPRWAPDSQSIAWLVQGKNGAGIVLTDPAGAHRRPVAGITRSVVDLAWSPDGRRIAAIESAPEAANKGRLFFMQPESDYRATAPPSRSLWLIDVAAGTQRELTHDAWSYGGPVTDHDPSWSPDGHSLAVVRQPTPVYGDFEHAQYVAVDVGSGAVAQIVSEPFFAYPASAAPVYGSDGEIAYTHTWDGKLPSREDVFVNGRDVSAALDRDLWSCSNGAMSWQSGMLLANVLDGVAMRLYQLDPSGTRPPAALTSSDGSVIAYSTARDGTIAYLWTTPEMLPELFARSPDGTTRQVTHLFTLPADLPTAPMRAFEWNDAAGHQLHGLLSAPPGDTAKVPLIVEPHGGPQCADPIGFTPIAQYLASNGYAYFRPDPPGSDGYGDWSYKAIVGDFGPLPMDADFAGVDALYAAGIGDRNRTFIEGGSYGGYLTSWIVTHSTRFKAAVAEVPLTDLELEYALSESPNILRRFFGATPATNPSLLEQQSPLTYAAAERTPLLLVIGLRDTRAPYVQGIEFYKALLDYGAPVKLIADPLAGHGPNDPQGFNAWWSATLAWFARYGGLQLPDARLPPGAG